MAAISLTDTWEIKNYANVFEAATKDEPLISPFLGSLEHFSFPGLKWRFSFYARGEERADADNASLYVQATFGTAKNASRNVWATRDITVVADHPRDNLTLALAFKEYLPLYDIETIEPYDGWGKSNAFTQESLKRAVQTNGSLFLKLDLTIFKIADLLKCDTLRLLLSDISHADFDFKVGHVTFAVHRTVLAKRSTEFATLFRETTTVQGRGRNRVESHLKEFVLEDTTPEAFGAFRSALYFENFAFLSEWKLALGVLKLAHKFKVTDLSKICNDALAEKISSLCVADVLQILPIAFRCEASVTKAACIDRLDANKDWTLTFDWAAFKEEYSDVSFAIMESLLKKSAGEVSPQFSALNAAELTFSHLWSIPSAALAPNPPSITSDPFLEHKAFPLVKWQMELHPVGNGQDPELKRGFASLYLKATFGSKDEDLKAVYAKWKATIVAKDEGEYSAPASPEFVIFTGKDEMKFGFANAFEVEHLKAAIDVQNGSLAIRLDLTVAKIPEILKRHELISSLFSSNDFADVEIDVNGTIFKAHKCILAVRSTVFERMFETEMQESQTSKVDVEDTTPAAFKFFLAAVYYANWDFLGNQDDTFEVLKLAEKYAVLDVKAYCDEALAHFVTPANLFEILPKAAIHNASATKAACVEILFANEEMLKSNGWIQFKRSNKDLMADVAEALGERYRAGLKRKHDDD